jgi:hypothetical protein
MGGFFVPLSLMRTYRMSLISAGSISLDSTFNILLHNLRLLSYFCFFNSVPETGLQFVVWNMIRQKNTVMCSLNLKDTIRTD